MPSTCPTRSVTAWGCGPHRGQPRSAESWHVWTTTRLTRRWVRGSQNTAPAPTGTKDCARSPSTGKSLHGSRTAATRAVHLLAAVTHGERATLNQRQVAGKKGEISEFKPLLTPLGLDGRTITFDAPHTQHAHAQFLVEEKKADYIAIVKDNHPKLRGFLRSLSWNQNPLGHATREKGHSRGEIRRLKAVQVPRRLRLPHAAQAIKVTRRRRDLNSGKIQIEHVYAITSHDAFSATDAQLSRAVREHWHVEARHHVRDHPRRGRLHDPHREHAPRDGHFPQPRDRLGPPHRLDQHRPRHRLLQVTPRPCTRPHPSR
ncbi:ISAs1 family transposase [Streptomyces hokutonensis]|uniref:ISAs1 family transposase n=1 Tax=Streptomyces hokutonensis TaxID=1306990 RepID=A0ABW6M5P1_9ACTN